MTEVLRARLPPHHRPARPGTARCGRLSRARRWIAPVAACAPFVCAAALLAAPACKVFFGIGPLPPGPRQPQEPPTETLAEKEREYTRLLDRLHDTKEGVVDYRVPIAPPASPTAPLVRRPRPPGEPRYGGHADTCHFTGIALAADALRFAVLGTDEAKRRLFHRLAGMEALEGVTGVPGLFARNLAPVAPGDPSPESFGKDWRPAVGAYSGRYMYRGDVSKDQYAGYAFGVGTLLACVEDPGVRARAAPLAARVADHLMANDYAIIDATGDETTYGNMAARVVGIPIGVNAAISLALVKAAAVATGERRFLDEYARLIDAGWHEVTLRSHFELFGVTKTINDHMAFLGLYPLLHLEQDEAVLEVYRHAAERLIDAVGDQQNAFFNFAFASRRQDPKSLRAAALVADGKRSMELFPVRKVPLPMDLSEREDLDLGERCLNDLDGRPLAERPVPMHLRAITTHMWSRSAFTLIANPDSVGDLSYVGVDYLLTYWMGRHHGYIAADE